jgi:outer membrane cobalamin receptor
LPDVFTLGVSLSYNFKWLKIYVDSDNLLNQEYELIKGYKMPRRNFSIGISSSFE